MEFTTDAYVIAAILITFIAGFAAGRLTKKPRFRPDQVHASVSYRISSFLHKVSADESSAKTNMTKVKTMLDTTEAFLAQYEALQ